jgi:hypothetical protein
VSDTYSTPSRPAQPPEQSPGPDTGAGQQNSVFDRWNSWIDKPGNRAAMMQFGIAMLQPMQPGESLLSHGANALGYAGEAENRVEQEAELRQQRESQEELRGAQANLAGARAETAGAQASARGLAANAAEDRLNFQRQNAGLQTLVRLQPAYAKEKGDWELTHDPTKEPFMSFQDWMESRGINPQSVTQPSGDAANTSQPSEPAKPLAKDILANPKYRPQFDELRKNPDKKAVKAVLDRIAPRVSDPQTLYKEFGVQ